LAPRAVAGAGAAGPRAATFLLPEQKAALRNAASQLVATMKDPAVKAGLTHSGRVKPR